jgi:hypothetical protein
MRKILKAYLFPKRLASTMNDVLQMEKTLKKSIKPVQEVYVSWPPYETVHKNL